MNFYVVKLSYNASPKFLDAVATAVVKALSANHAEEIVFSRLENKGHTNMVALATREISNSQLENGILYFRTEERTNSNVSM